jgi:hypothetical protein
VESDTSRGVASLPDGSAFVVGAFTSPSAFGTISLPVVNEEGSDAFVARVSPLGAWVWVSRVSSLGYVECSSVVAMADGSAVVCGRYSNTVTFGSISLDLVGYDAGFVARISSSGQWLWAVPVGAPEGTVFVEAVARSADNKIFVAGYFRNAPLPLGGTTLQPNADGNETLLVARLSGAGTWEWGATSSDGTNNITATSITVSQDGSVVIAGGFYGQHNLGSFALQDSGSGGYRHAFVAKLSPTGTWLWATAAGSESGSTNAESVESLSDGSCVVAGNMRDGPIGFGGSITIAPLDTRNIFVGRVSLSGSWQWVTRAGGPNGDIRDPVLAVRPDGSCVVTGRYSGTAPVGSTTLPFAEDDAVFVARITADGTWSWASHASGIIARARSIDTFADNSAVLTGRFTGEITFGTVRLVMAGEGEESDVFMARISADGAWP